MKRMHLDLIFPHCDGKPAKSSDNNITRFCWFSITFCRCTLGDILAPKPHLTPESLSNEGFSDFTDVVFAAVCQYAYTITMMLR